MFLDFLLGPPVPYLVKSSFGKNSMVSGAAAKMSYCMPEVKVVAKRSFHMPKVRAVAERSYPTQEVRAAAERSYPIYKVRRGGSEEIPLVQGKEQWLLFAGAAMKRYPMPKVRKSQIRR